MYNTLTTKRRAIPITFSREFEARLLALPTPHTSLTHDLESQVIKGSKLMEELENIHDIRHVDALKLLIAQTNEYLIISSPYFTQWSIHISEDVLDEIDLIIMTHGTDLSELGLRRVDQGSISVLLATAAISDVAFTR